jgi:hypothetical protein
MVQGVLLPAVAILLAAGCGKSTGTVSGKVLYDGKAVKGGVVTIVTMDGKASGKSDIAEDGSYSVSDLPLGDVRIAVDTRMLKPNPNHARAQKNLPKNVPPEAAASMGGPGAANADRYVAIPERYSELETSQLTYNVVAGPQEHAIELTK